MGIRQEMEDFVTGREGEHAFLPVKEIRFEPYVVKQCEMNSCGKYGTSWTCPPGVGKLEDLKQKYAAFETAFVFSTVIRIEDPFDVEGMFSGGKEHAEATNRLEERLRAAGYSFDVLGGAACNRCVKCTYPDAPCRFPEKAHPSLEAVGIDVVKLAASCRMRYHSGENTVTYFSAILFRED